MMAQSPRISGLDHVQLAMPPDKEDVARGFYRDLLGIPEWPKPPNLAMRGGCWFETGDTRLHLGVDPEFRPAKKAHPAIRVRGLEALSRRLVEAGCSVLADEPLAGRNRCYVDDPFGNRIELIEVSDDDAVFALNPIGHVRGGRVAPIDDDWGASRARIELDPGAFKSDALLGLDAFSHLEVIFLFHKVTADSIHLGARTPRGNPEWPKVGIFAQRGKNRPNRLGLCTCRLIGVTGLAVEVEGLDAIDGTPVLDIKPVFSGFLPRGEVKEPHWATEIMQGYW
jgi:tRNA (Thr-GGU) A37 N-methylase